MLNSLEVLSFIQYFSRLFMSQKTTSIDLPPPPQERGPKSGKTWLWLVCTVVALSGGIAAGVWLGGRSQDAGDGTGSPEVAEVSQSQAAPEVNQTAVEALLKQAREAISKGDWAKAGDFYRSALESDPDNAEAKASLPLIERRLFEANGTLVVNSEPEGARVVIAGREPMVTPAEIPRLPVGEMILRIEKDGFQPVETVVAIVERETVLVPKIALQPSQGGLELVSEPAGADFRLLRVDGHEPTLVDVGQTPKNFDALDTGVYEARLAIDGWPEQVHRVEIAHGRVAGVSAVFAKGGINIVSDPIGAEVWSRTPRGQMIRRGVTPLTLTDLPPGRHQVEVRYQQWAPIRRTFEVQGNITQDLEFAWERSMVSFTSDPPGAAVYQNKRRIGRGNAVTPFIEEIPEGDYLFEARYPQLASVAKGVYIEGSETNLVDFQLSYGSVSIESEPAGAAVVANGVPVGRTPLKDAVVSPGDYNYLVSLEDHKATTLSGRVEPGGSLTFSTKLIPDTTPKISRDFVNGVGQQMVWFGQLGGWVAATEVTQEVYENQVKYNPSDIKNPKHPVSSVTWYDAARFCQGLSVSEGALGNMPNGYVYRLPTDAEWSVFSGETSLRDEVTSKYQRQRSAQPVASTVPNNFGLYDIRGNVAEWVEDWYSQRILSLAQSEGSITRQDWVGTDRKVLRGGSWLRSTSADLEVAYRRGARPTQKDANDVGFRVVLMPK